MKLVKNDKGERMFLPDGGTEYRKVVTNDAGDMMYLPKGGDAYISVPSMGDGSQVRESHGRLSNVASGLNEGAADIAGSFVDLAQGALNLPYRASNLAASGINSVFGTDLLDDVPMPYQNSFGGSQHLKGVMEDVGMVEEDDGAHPLHRRFGQFAGAGLSSLFPVAQLSRIPKVAQGTGALSSAARQTSDFVRRNPLKSAVGETAAAAAAVPGGEFGEKIGGDAAEALGVDRSYGEMPGRTLGEVVASMAPGVVTSTAAGALRKGLGTPESEKVYDLFANRGLQPSSGLVGGPVARTFENIGAINPVSSGAISEVQSGQVTGVSDEVGKTITQIAGGRPPSSDVYDAGTRAGDAIQTNSVGPRGEPVKVGALPDLQRKVKDLGAEEIAAMGGPTQAVDVANIRTEMARDRAGLTPSGQATLDGRLAELEAMRITPKDPALDAQLKTRLKTQEQDLKILNTKKAPLTSTEKRRARNLRHRIKETENKIDANLGVRNDQLDNWRKELGTETASRDRLSSETAGTGYRAVKDTGRETASKLGLEDRLNEATAEKRRILDGSLNLETGGEMDFLTKLSTKEPDLVFKTISSKDGAGKLMALKRVMPESAFKAIAGDVLNMMGKPVTAAQHASELNTDTFSPSQFSTNWKKLPEASKDTLIPDADLRAEMEDLVAMSDALVARGKASNPSGTTNAALAAGMVAGGVTKPIRTATGMAMSGAASRLFLTENMAKIIAGKTPTLQDKAARRAPGAATRETTREEEK